METGNSLVGTMIISIIIVKIIIIIIIDRVDVCIIDQKKANR